MVGPRLRLVHCPLIDVVHSRLCCLALADDTRRLHRRKLPQLSLIAQLFNSIHPQKLRVIVRIDEDVTQLREKMQAEAKKIANS
jgi:hypothetical protein